MISMNPQLVRGLLGATTALLLQACAITSFERNIDIANDASFGDFKTYAWISDDPLQSGGSLSPLASPVLEPHIRLAVETELGTKGYRRVDAQDADLIVAFRTATQDKVRIRNTYDSFGYQYYGFSRGFSRGFGRFRRFDTPVVARTITEGSLILDFFDNRTKQALWHGSATKPLSASASPAEHIQEAAMSLLDGFPKADTTMTAMKDAMG